MPYKHIAAHLKKTELACRLHYHQLSHGTNRRKRAASFSSTTSSTHSPVSPEQRMSPEAELSTAPTTPEQNSDRHDSVGGAWKTRAELPDPASSTTTAADSPVVHKPILPKPVPSLPYPVPRNQAGLRLDCNVAAAATRPRQPAINRERLRDVYEAHRVSFWKMIAADYGDGVDPAVLEETWRKGSVQGPPTPDESVENCDRFGSIGEGRVVLPALQPSASASASHHHHHHHQHHFERPFGRLHRRLSVSSAPSPILRPMAKLPTPSTAGSIEASSSSSLLMSAASLSSSSSVPATAIAALLNGASDFMRDSPRSDLPPRIAEDATMSDADT